jgi:transcription-repair coupling factor (superfamily II helicase)
LKNKILKIYEEHPHRGSFSESLNQQDNRILLKGLAGSVKTIFPASIHNIIPNNQVFILTEKEEASYFFSDLTTLLGEDKVLFFPSSFKRNVQLGQLDNDNVVLRTEVLNRLSSGEKNLYVVTYTEALAENVVTKKKLKENTLFLRRGEKISLEFLHEVLLEYGFEQVDFVFNPGEYSIRGSIADVFSFSGDTPFRIDFFGDEVESIRKFDVETQLSHEKAEKISIVPNTCEIAVKKSQNPEKELECFTSFVSDHVIFWTENLPYSVNYLNDLFEKTDYDTSESSIQKDHILTTGNNLLKFLDKKIVIEFGQQTQFNPSKVFEFNISPQPAFNKNFGLLASNLDEHFRDGFLNLILSENEKQIERLNAIFQEIYGKVNFEPLLFTIHNGFIDYNLKICCYTDHQIFERYHRFKYRGNFGNRESLTIKELHGLHPGDFVVHIDHGIGQFGGLEKININGKFQEAVRLVYQDKDVLFVSIHSLHRISKYKGKDGIPPKIYKLGSPAWQKLKDKTKSRIKDIAKDLIALYAKRKNEKGFSFSPDTYLQNELEASFIYEDTPDQLKATQAVKTQMESTMPMDMLVCGDVGFGKTEVAIRAAFKAVTDGKQVGVLVPTTLLAMQHYKTFTDRLRSFPCTVEYISRLRPSGVQKEILKTLPEGKIDILIGTHKLLGKEVQFKDLGLLIIDEEQKFGVAAKEKLKQMRINVDTLTLTATPIPRTLQFSLMGARDLAIINTPPPNRHPIITELHSFNEHTITDAIIYEVQRGGQVFFIHNRIQNIKEVEAVINKVCPGIKTVVAHGQMEGSKLEKIMIDFVNGNYDVLVSTSIIESGLDIPNANTIIINNAQNFGLSDLHQLRGRVGRSNKKAFCYLLAPPSQTLTGEARRRLRAIEEYSELGSGFNIAMQDLDIRGAGNLLGSEQSGFIADIGFEAYNKILNEALQELKETEFKELFSSKDHPDVEKQNYLNDCHIDTDLELLFPETYVPSTTERIHLYRSLDSSENEERLQRFELSLSDRFGQIPEATRELINVVRLRWLAIDLGFEKIILKNGKMIAHFISYQLSPYYQSNVFNHILSFVQREPGLFRMKEDKNKLTLTVDKISSVSDAIKLLLRIKA